MFGDMDDDGFYMAELRGHRGLVPRESWVFNPPFTGASFQFIRAVSPFIWECFYAIRGV